MSVCPTVFVLRFYGCCHPSFYLIYLKLSSKKIHKFHTNYRIHGLIYLPDLYSIIDILLRQI